ncbi:MAG: hydrogenase maturation protease [Thermoplasmata archaeon]|nr:hydrogenase maturation protease [Thermoplasmata archaeon]
MIKKILLLGIGNPILTDDAIGILVAREIAKLNLPDVNVQEVAASGIEVMELMLDYEKVVIVDAIMLPDKNPGEIIQLEEKDFSHTVSGASPHGINLSTAIALGRQTAPERMPKEIVFFAMQAEDASTFGEIPTEEVGKKLPDLINTVIDEINK